MFLLDLLAGVLICSWGATYLYFIHFVRKHSEHTNIRTDDNFFVLNFYAVYRSYLAVRKLKGLNGGAAFYLHFVFLIVGMILVYCLQGGPYPR